MFKSGPSVIVVHYLHISCNHSDKNGVIYVTLPFAILAPMIQVLIFDFFDVIRADGFKHWLQAHGYELSGAFLAASERNDRGEISIEGFYQALADASGQTAQQIEHEMEDDVELDHEIVAYIDSLHGTYRTALLSNSRSDYIRAELAKHDLEKHFDEIFISSEVGHIKPEPAIFQHALDKLGITADECVFIDDNPRNTAGAAALGIHTITYTDLPALKSRLNRQLSVV